MIIREHFWPDYFYHYCSLIVYSHVQWFEPSNIMSKPDACVQCVQSFLCNEQDEMLVR